MSRRLYLVVTRAVYWIVPLLFVLPLVSATLTARQDPGSPAAPISRTSWTSIGPGNIGGRVRALAVHPTSASTVFAGGANGGIWKSTDGGASWAPVNDYLPSLAITSIIFQPGNASVMYAGTGESLSTPDGARGVGILKSTDGGATWAALAATATSDFFYVNRLAMSADGSILLAATSTGLFRSTDGGASFTQVLSVSPSSFGYTEIEDVKFVTGSNTTAVAAGNSENVYQSTNGGQTWNIAFPGPTPLTTNATAPRSVEIAIASPTVVYLSINSNDGDSCSPTPCSPPPGQVWKSVNAGASYAKVGSPGHLVNYGNTSNTIWADPTDPAHNTIVVGGGNLYRSTDGGANWIRISAKDFFLEGLSIHGGQHIIAADSGYNGSTNRRVYIGNDGGVWKADDIMQPPHATVHPCCSTIDFTPLNHDLGITQFFGGAGHVASGVILGGTAGNGTAMYTPAAGVNGWTPMLDDDASYAAIDPSDPNYRYGGASYLRLYRSTTGGGGAVSIDSCGTAYALQDSCNGNANFTAPWLLDPNNNNRLLAGGVSLWRTDDAKADASVGPHWAAIKSSSGGSPISALTVVNGNADVIWVGHSNGDVYATATGTSGSPAWQKVDGSLPDRPVLAIAVDPHNTNVAYVGFDGFNADNVWKTTNNGSTWTALTGTPALPIHSITIDPRGSEFVFLGTDRGVFTSSNAGAAWDATTVGPANTAVDQLFWMGSTLVAATHGRGMFTANVPSPITANPASLSFTAERNPGGPAILTMTPSQTLTVTYTGPTTPTWSSVAVPQWISVTNGATAGTYKVTVINPSNVIGSNTSLSGSIVFTSSNAGTSITIPVSLTILTNTATDPHLSVDAPSNGASVPRTGFSVSGWAIDRGSAIGAGIDAVHVWAFPTNGGSATFVGAVAPLEPRGDVGAIFGAQFAYAGFHINATNLTNGAYHLVVYAHSAVTDSFSTAQQVDITVTDPVSTPYMSVDYPGDGLIGPSFAVSGWAIDTASTTGTGVDAVHVWAFHRTGSTIGSGVFLGVANYGGGRGDVGALFGSRFTNSAFSLQVTSLAAGDYALVVYPHSTVSGTFFQSRVIYITVGSGSVPAMSIDAPGNGSTVSHTGFYVAGWAIDRGATSGTGVDAVHVYAFPVGGGAATFLGVASYGGARSDIGAAFGTQFTNSGFGLNGAPVAAGDYYVAIYPHSTVTGAFLAPAVVRVTVN